MSIFHALQLTTPIRRFLVCVIATLTLVSFITPLSAPAGATTTTAPLPGDDPFYTMPSNISSYANGAIVRWRTSPAAITFLFSKVASTAWQVAFRSNDMNNQPILGITTVIVPKQSYTSGPRPVVTYQAAEDSTGIQCSPSYTLETDSNILTSVEQSVMALALFRGIALNVTDYEGPNSEYIVGDNSARIVLDSMRAIQHFSTAGFNTSTPLGVWGYSGGGYSTAWAAELQASYAPDLHIAGIAFGGAPVNLSHTLHALDGSLYAGFIEAAMISVNKAFPSLDLYSQLNAAGVAAFHKADNSCAAQIAFQLPLTHIDSYTNVPDAIDLPRNQPIVTAEDLLHSAPISPVYDYYSTNDEAVPTADSQQLVAQYCQWGVQIVTSPDSVAEHAILAASGASGALDFLQNRFAGKAFTRTC